MQFPKVMTIVAVACGLTAGLPALQAQVCVDNSLVSGLYGFAAGRQMMGVMPSSQPSGSSPVETLVNGATGTAPFTDVGAIYADGQGSLFVVDNQSSVRTQVGAYTVYFDCTVTLGLKANPAGVPVTLDNADLTLAGVLVSGGNEIDLQPQAPATQSGTQSTSTAAAPSFLMTMQRAAQTGFCSTSNLAGSFGVQGSGFTSAGGVSPFVSLGIFRADGAGNLNTNNSGETSGLPGSQFTGTYTVNPDCTGTATLVAGDGTSRAINFVIVSDPATQRSRLLFNYGGPAVFGTGVAVTQ